MLIFVLQLFYKLKVTGCVSNRCKTVLEIPVDVDCMLYVDLPCFTNVAHQVSF